jgi:hypothetical protein
MDAETLARSVQQGGNFLGVFLCTGALAALRARAGSPELNDLLVRGLATYAPAFRAMQQAVEGPEVEPALERLDALTRLGVDFDAPGEVAPLRAALRELLAKVGFELPGPLRGEGVACELHGAACPSLGEAAEPPARRARASSRRPRSGGRAPRTKEKRRRQRRRSRR